METEREDTANVDLFWMLFNKALGKVVNEPLIKFNPIGWCSDRAGANLAGITRVYGNASPIKSCELHFKDHRNKKAQKLHPDLRDFAIDCCIVRPWKVMNLQRDAWTTSSLQKKTELS